MEVIRQHHDRVDRERVPAEHVSKGRAKAFGVVRVAEERAAAVRDDREEVRTFLDAGAPVSHSGCSRSLGLRRSSCGVASLNPTYAWTETRS